MPGQNSKSSSVIKAYCPSRLHDLPSIDSSTMQVGTVQYFMQHKLHFRISGKVEEHVHLCACVKWKRLHIHYDWFGSSATVFDNTEELECTNFIPIQRITRRCRYITLPVNFKDFTKTVFYRDCIYSMSYYIEIL